MEVQPPHGYHLNIVTRKRVAQWSDSGLHDVFTSEDALIIAASETPGQQRLLAIADGRAILLHDLADCTVKKHHKLGSTTKAVQLLAFGHAQELYFTVHGFDYVFGYSLDRDRVISKIELPSAAVTLSVSKLYLLVSCSEQTQLLLIAIQTKQVWRFDADEPSSTVVATAFHPVHDSIFAIVNNHGTVSIYDATKLPAADQGLHRARIGRIEHLHIATDAQSPAIIAMAFLADHTKRLVTVGSDRKCHVVLLGANQQKLISWDVGCMPSCIAVLCDSTAPVFEQTAEPPHTLIAVGRVDGRVSVFEMESRTEHDLIVDLQHNIITSLEFIQAPAARSASRLSEQHCAPGLSEKEAAYLPSKLTQVHRSDHSENTDTTPRASHMPRMDATLISPMSRKSSVASFSSALSHLQSPAPQESTETIIVNRPCEEAGDFGFADVDATRRYTKPKRPQTPRRAGLLPRASRLLSSPLGDDWQTIHTIRTHTPVSPEAPRPQVKEASVSQLDLLSPRRVTLPSDPPLTSITTWSRNTVSPILSPTRLIHQRVGPQLSRVDDTVRMKNSVSSMRRSNPLDRDKVNLLRPHKHTSTKVSPRQDQRMGDMSADLGSGTLRAAAAREDVTSNDNRGEPDYDIVPTDSAFEADDFPGIAIAKHPPLDAKPLPDLPAIVAPSPSPAPDTERVRDHAGTVEDSAPTRLSATRHTLATSATILEEFTHIPPDTHHSCPCNCAVLSTLHRLETQVLRLNEELAHHKHKEVPAPREPQLHASPPQPRSHRSSPSRQNHDEGWVRIGRFLVP